MSAGSYDGSIRINTQVDGTGFNKGVKSIGSNLDGLMSLLKGVAGAVGVAFGVAAVVNFGKQAIETASDLIEVQNVVDTAFGSMAYMANDFAKTAVDKFGMSELSAKQTASTFMAMSSGMGIVGKSGADMSLALTGLTGDMSSFYNVSQDVAATALKSIYTGETESLKQFGVVMTQANLQQFAYSRGIRQSIDSMTQAQQVQLRYQYVTQQLSLAQGDFSKTSGSWANQTRVLSERWKEFLGIIGTGLIQLLTPAVQFLNNTMSMLISFAQTASSVIGGVFGKQAEQQNSSAQATQKAASSQNALAAATNKTAAATKKAGDAAKKSVASFDELNILSKPSSSDAPGATDAAMSGTAPVEIGTGTKASPDVQNAASTVKDALKGITDFGTDLFKRFAPSVSAWSDAFGALKEPAANAFESIRTSLLGLWDNTLKPYYSYILMDWIPSITNGFSTTFAPIFADVMPVAFSEFAKDFDFACQQIDKITKDIFQPTMEFMKGVALDIFDGIKKGWDEHGAGILQGFETFRESLRQIWTTIYENVIKPVFGYIGQTVSWLWDNHLKPLWDNITDFVGSLTEFILMIWNQFLSPMVNWIVKEFGPPISYVIGIIGDVIGTIFGIISDVVGGILKVLSGLMDFLTGIFTGNWSKAWNGILKIVGGVWDTIWGVIKGVINLVIDGLNSLWGGVYYIVRKIVDAVGGIAGAIGSVFGQNWSFSMPASVPKIPKLANGAVIPPNQQFMALLGDQTRGNNLEAPENLIRQIVREESGGANASILKEMLAAIKAGKVISVDGIPLAQTVTKYQAILGSR